jgi:hypothetical protein
VRPAGKGFNHGRLELLAVGLTSVTITARHSLAKSAEEARGQMASIIEAQTKIALSAA